MTQADRPRRRGFTMIAVLALLGLAGMLFVSWTKTVVRETHQTRMAHEQAQAECLAHAALDRAAARWAEDAEYRGEQWRLTRDELGQSFGAVARIEVTDDGRATVTLSLPSVESPRVQITRSQELPSPLSGDS